MVHVSTSEVKVRKGEGATAEQLAELFGPGQADQLLRQAMQFCWMALPENRRNAEELERQMRRLVDRALKDFREDKKAFGRSPKAKKGRKSN
jgi:hypothetical protein